MRRLAAGEAPMTPGIMADIRKIAVARGRTIASLIKRLPQ